MPWATALSIGGNLLGGFLGSKSAKSAAQQQAQAAQAALNTQRTTLGDITNSYQPYTDAGSAAVGQMSKLAGQPLNINPLNDPGYQFGMDQGLQQVQNSAAAQGGLYSGAALKGLTRFANDYATTKYNDAFNRQRAMLGDTFNRYGTLAGYGQNALGNITGARENYANQATGILTGNGNAQAASKIASGNAWQNALNGVLGGSLGGTGGGGMGSLQGWFSNTPIGGSGFGTGLAYGNQDYGQYFADGGPVLPPPVVSPDTATKMGQMSEAERNALISKLQIKEQAMQPKLPFGLDRVDAAERAALGKAYGGPVKGPGGPRDDMVPAMLSNGEHVMDTASVNAIGGGSNAKGQKKLNALRAMLHRGQ